jgi:hydroxymethylglutaryl-CoA reductase
MVIEESSVIAAACKAAKFWRNKGGFKTSILNFKKTGQVHFIFKGDKQKLNIFFKNNKLKFFEDCKEISSNMKKRGGGILDIELLDKTHDIDHYFQINAVFDTVDSMGANFINSCLEQFASTLENEIKLCSDITSSDYSLEIIMSILSNYVPQCLVRAEVSCDLGEIDQTGGLSGKEYANKFIQAINIAKTQTSRAVTHNKGIMNGVDSVVIATGNDFRAIEAGVHAYAAKSGMYKSLTDACVENNTFKFWIEIPLALGTIGGITNLHPLVKWSLELLKNPNAKELMKIVAVAGLAQNFGAVNSLITTGIQKGHMKMHLINILNSLNASENEKTKLIDFFKNNTLSFSSVKNELEKLR